jgi:hypothetical protein
MTELFHIALAPPVRSLRETAASLFQALGRVGWVLESVVCHNRSEGKQVKEYAPGSLEVVLAADSALASFNQQERWIELSVGFHKAGLVELVSDKTFFLGSNPVLDLRAIFRGSSFPPDTVVVGDLEGRFPAIAPMGVVMAFRRRATLARRPRKHGFNWIEQLTASQWTSLLERVPELGGNELAKVGQSHVVLMWETPYDRESRRSMEPVARELLAT